MPWEFREDAPIYTQLIAQIQQRHRGRAVGAGGAAALGADLPPRPG